MVNSDVGIWNQFPSGNAIIRQGSEGSGCVVQNRSAEKSQDEKEKDDQAHGVAVAMTWKDGLKLCRETDWKEPEGPKHIMFERNMRKGGKTWCMCKTFCYGPHYNCHKRQHNRSLTSLHLLLPHITPISNQMK